MPVISSVTVTSFAATNGDTAANKSSTPTAAMIVRIMLTTSGQIIPLADLGERLASDDQDAAPSRI
jgi:hypothetical protein